MNQRQLDLAAEFCELVGKTDLLEYVAAEPDEHPESVRAKLKARRRYMQGMQSNPKYKKEALFLIKNFASLNEVLADAERYLADVQARQESTHLPVLEMTIRGVLAGGHLSGQQEEFLRHQAGELGVSPQTFEGLLSRLAGDAGVTRPSPRTNGTQPAHATEPPNAVASSTPGPGPAPLEYTPSTPQPREPRPDSAATGPPARSREELDPPGPETSTAPPVRPRGPGAATPSPTEDTILRGTQLPDAPPIPAGSLPRGTLGVDKRVARLEVLGEPVRALRIANRPLSTEIRLRNAGDVRWSGRVSTDEGWLIAQPTRLDPNKREQVITVRINPRDLFESPGLGNVTIQTDTGERVSIAFEVTKTANLLPFAIAAGAVALLGLVAFVAFAAFQLLGEPSPAKGLTITVDPTSEAIPLDGEKVGSGSQVNVPAPNAGQVTITVVQSNYRTHEQVVTLDPGRTTMVPVTLQLARDLDFRPAPDMRNANLGKGAAKKIPRAALDQCIRAGQGGALAGQVRIYIGPDGKAAGITIEGDEIEDPAVVRCLTRHAATVRFPPLKDGDFAAVRYDFEVTGANN
jgi:hypothetical protein